MANGHGGRRQGAGRKPGSASQKTREIANRAAKDGLTPLEYMLAVLRDDTAEPDRRDRGDGAALPWRRRQAGVGGHLPPVVELAEQALRPEDGGGLWADTLQPRQHGRRRGRLVTGGLEQSVAFRLDSLQLPQQDLEPIQLADNLRLQAHRQGPAVTCPQVL